MKTIRPITHFLPNRLPAVALACALSALAPAVSRTQDHAHLERTPREASPAIAKRDPSGLPPAVKLPPLRPGVAEIKFNEFFVTPVGVQGLEVTEKLQQLDGRRVRILGYMVHQEEPPAGRFLLTPMPAQIHEHDNGLADDLPASTLYVSVPTLRHAQVPYVPGLMLLTGTLSVGNMTEPDGRISVARLALDPPETSATSSRSRTKLSTPSGKGAERLMSTTSRTANVAP